MPPSAKKFDSASRFCFFTESLLSLLEAEKMCRIQFYNVNRQKRFTSGWNGSDDATLISIILNSKLVLKWIRCINGSNASKCILLVWVAGFYISVSWNFWQSEVNSQCLAMAAREHGAVEVDVAVAGGVPGEIFRVGLAITLSHNQNFGRYF